MNKPSFSRWVPAQVFGITVAAFFSPICLSAEAIDHLNVQEPNRPAYLPAKPGEAFQLPPVPPAPSAVPGGDGETFFVRQIGFRGNTVFATSELDPIAAPYAGRRVSEAEIEELRQKLTRHYTDRGYVNSGAILVEAALVDDRLTFDLIEGRLTGVRLRGLERLREDYVVGRLVRDEDAVLNVEVLRERFQLLLDDPLFERMNARLMPDTRLGEAILDIDVVRAKPYQLTAFVNNYRPPSIGSNTFGLSGWVRNLTGRGDVLDASLQDSLSDVGSARMSLGWHLPVNRYGTQVSLQIDHGRSSVIEQPMQVLDIQSTLDSQDIGLSQTFVETLRHKLTFGVNRVLRENRTTLLGVPFSFTTGEPDGVTRIRAWRFWQEYSYRSEHQVLALRSTFTTARNNLQEASALPAGTAPQAERQYGYWLGQAHFARQVLDNGAQFIVRVNVQQAKDALLPLDRMSIGGVNTVRGYRENQMIRDRGAIVNLEFDVPLLRGADAGLNLSLIPFYDRGRGKNRNEAAETISSAGVAARVNWQHFNLAVVVARRLQHPDSVGTAGASLQDKGIHCQLSYQFQ